MKNTTFTAIAVVALSGCSVLGNDCAKENSGNCDSGTALTAAMSAINTDFQKLAQEAAQAGDDETLRVRRDDLQTLAIAEADLICAQASGGGRKSIPEKVDIGAAFLIAAAGALAGVSSEAAGKYLTAGAGFLTVGREVVEENFGKESGTNEVGSVEVRDALRELMEERRKRDVSSYSPADAMKDANRYYKTCL